MRQISIVMRHLCDTNVFLAAMIEEHTKHDVARNWFNELKLPDTAEYCRAIQTSILRLSCQKITENYKPLTNEGAIAAFGILRSP